MKRLLPSVLAAAVAGAVGLAVAGWQLLRPDRVQYEEPTYTVESSNPTFEVRAYEATLQARVTVSGSRERATQQGFRILAGYIFGGNQAKQSIAMTTPVSAAPQSQSIEMTAPVSATASATGWTVGFTMPRQWTLDTLPVPNDSRVQLVAVSAHRAAVRSFTGRANQARVADEERALLGALEALGLQANSGVTLAQFDPPWVLGPWRRNELQVGLGGPNDVDPP